MIYAHFTNMDSFEQKKKTKQDQNTHFKNIFPSDTFILSLLEPLKKKFFLLKFLVTFPLTVYMQTLK